MANGRERRRTDLYGRARRYLYGVMLLATAPAAIAADQLALVGRYRPPLAVTASTAEFISATLQGLVLLHARERTDPAAPLSQSPLISLDTVTAHVTDDAGGEVPRFRVAVVETGLLRDGAGFDLTVPEIGNFHLNLYARNNAKTDGKRWTVGDAGIPHSWSLGGTMELVRTLDGGRHFAFVPELKLDIDDSRARYLPFQASIKYANWRSTTSDRAFAEQVPQIAFKWRL